MTIRATFVVLLCLSAGANRTALAFDCSKATTPVEKRICANADLRNLDDRLERFYATALDFMDQSACLKADERAWLAKIRNQCSTIACLQQAYLMRLGTLAGLQPGMSGSKGSDLPATPRLRLFIAPTDPLDAFKVVSSTLYEGRGTIDHVLDKGGFVLKTADGGVHAIISDLAIQPGTFVQLDSLKAQQSKVIVSGWHGKIDKTTLGFDNRYCIAVYEQP